MDSTFLGPRTQPLFKVGVAVFVVSLLAGKPAVLQKTPSQLILTSVVTIDHQVVFGFCWKLTFKVASSLKMDKKKNSDEIVFSPFFEFFLHSYI